MDPLTVDIKHGKDMWFARDANGKMDSSQGGDGGVAKVGSICSLIFISDFMLYLCRSFICMEI